MFCVHRVHHRVHFIARLDARSGVLVESGAEAKIVERFGMIVQTADDAIAIHLEIIRVTVHTIGCKNAEGSAIFFDGLAHLDHFGNAIGALGGIGEICPAVARF